MNSLCVTDSGFPAYIDKCQIKMLAVTLLGMKGTERNLSYVFLWVIELFSNEGLRAEAVELVEYLELFFYIFESNIFFSISFITLLDAKLKLEFSA